MAKKDGMVSVGKNVPVGAPGVQVWGIPDEALLGYRETMEELSDRKIDLEAQYKKDQTRLEYDKGIMLSRLADDAGVPVGTNAEVQGRYFVERTNQPPARR